jgi:predicted RND superfamily exporter protein
MRSEAARRAQIKALSKTLAQLATMVTAVCGFLLFLAPPIEWRLAAGVLAGIGLYLASEALIPLYVDADDEAGA